MIKNPLNSPRIDLLFFKETIGRWLDSPSEYCLQRVYLYRNREQDEASTKKKNYLMRNPFRHSLMASSSLAYIKCDKKF